jgi:hypothetical protein
VKQAWLVLAILIGLAQAFHFRNSMNPDGIAYLDMGDAYLRGDWATALRSHWSPLYAVVLATALRGVQPPPELEFPLVHLVNLFIYCLALGAFAFLMREVVACRAEIDAESFSGVPKWAAISLGYGAFVWCTSQYVPLSLVTPDLLVAAVVFATAGVILWTRRQPSWRASALLGVLLGLGYLAKAPMLPLVLVLLAASVVVLDDRRRRVPHLKVAAIALAVFAVPFAVALSVVNGRPTVGDSARLNYLWRINGLPLVHWHGGPNGVGQPIHQSTLLLETPPTFAFDSPFPVTYAAWYAPEYWFEGATPMLVRGAQLQAIADTLPVYTGLLTDLRVPLTGFALLLAMRMASRHLAVGPWVALLAPALAALAMYTLVLVEARYVAPFLVLLIVGLLTLVQLPRTRPGSTVMGSLSALVALGFVLQIGWATLELGRETLSHVVGAQPMASDDQAQVAVALRAAGVQPGDPVASGNRAFNAYWARLARVRIVAEVTGYDATALLEADPEARRVAQQALLGQQVRAVVAHGWPAYTGDPNWQRVEETEYFYYLVHHQQ